MYQNEKHILGLDTWHDIAQELKLYIQKETLTKMYKLFQSDLIDNMNHILILSQIKLFKQLTSNGPELPKQAEAKRDVAINKHNDNLINFKEG